MKRIYVSRKGLLKRNETYTGVHIEREIADMIATGEVKMMAGKALLYTKREDGVLPETNIRTDRMKLAQDARDLRERTRIMVRDGNHPMQTEEAKAKALAAEQAKLKGGTETP